MSDCDDEAADAWSDEEGDACDYEEEEEEAGEEEEDGNCAPPRKKSRVPRVPKARANFSTKAAVEDGDDTSESDSDGSATAVVRSQFRTVGQSRRDGEREMYKSRRVMNEMKRKRTLIRASKPKANKHTQIAKPAAMQVVDPTAQEARFVRPPADVSLGARLAELDAAIAQVDEEGEARQALEARRAMCESNYYTWTSVYMHSLGAITAHEKTSAPTPRPRREQRTMGDFFKKAPDAVEKRVARYFDILYHFEVLPSTVAFAMEPLKTMEELDTVFGERFSLLEGNHHQVLNSAKKKQDSNAAKLELIAPKCPDCDVELIEDTKEANASCPKCGTCLRGAYSYKNTYSEMQATSKGAAPYMRIAHVSIQVCLVWFDLV